MGAVSIAATGTGSSIYYMISLYPKHFWSPSNLRQCQMSVSVWRPLKLPIKCKLHGHNIQGDKELGDRNYYLYIILKNWVTDKVFLVWPPGKHAWLRCEVVRHWLPTKGSPDQHVTMEWRDFRVKRAQHHSINYLKHSCFFKTFLHLTQLATTHKILSLSDFCPTHWRALVEL